MCALLIQKYSLAPPQLEIWGTDWSFPHPYSSGITKVGFPLCLAYIPPSWLGFKGCPGQIRHEQLHLQSLKFFDLWCYCHLKKTISTSVQCTWKRHINAKNYSMKKHREKLSDIIKIGTVYCRKHKCTSFKLQGTKCLQLLTFPTFKLWLPEQQRKQCKWEEQAGPQETQRKKQRVAVTIISLATAAPTTEIIPGHWDLCIRKSFGCS